ncbi:MAG: hypothetical protein JNK81_10810 [Anaerolineales bacterium]|nr:hypothetical protein [Anaerolineales bacterium]
MNYSFPHYLLAKQSVDDRALNKDVVKALQAHLPQRPIRIVEVGAGVGTMLKRLVCWNIISKAEYVMVDKLTENIEYASAWIPQWAEETGLSVERSGKNQLRVFNQAYDIHIQLTQADVFDFIPKNKKSFDVLIAHAFLDLLPMPKSLEKLFMLTNHLAWLTLNFDGVTTFEPTIDTILDKKIERLYHKTMKASGGDSQSGRHLFNYLQKLNAEILAAGSSDWVVHAIGGKYPQDEAYFLHFILHFFEESLKDCKELNKKIFFEWLRKRHEQIENGELVYVAHQLDFLAKVHHE